MWMVHRPERSDIMRLDGKVALITGAGAGIGRRAALLFAQEGAKVAIAEINEAAGRAVAQEVTDAGGQAVFVHTDVTEPESVQAAVRTAVTTFGKLDTLYNNAGGTNPKDAPVTEVPIEIFWATLRRDLFGTFLVCRFGIPEIIKAGGGAVVNTSSLVALRGKPRPSAVSYSTAKGGVSAMTRAMAVEYAPHKVRVNAVAPGITVTERLAQRIKVGAVPDSIMDRHLLGPLDPIDIAHMALYLASDDARMITGQIISVDSGAAMS
jgi:NAD(P)-dependent dehydrogenase (short-subunit alcohol dehydrogenase family)